MTITISITIENGKQPEVAIVNAPAAETPKPKQTHSPVKLAEPRICPFCGDSFQPVVHNQMFCKPEHKRLSKLKPRVKKVSTTSSSSPQETKKVTSVKLSSTKESHALPNTRDRNFDVEKMQIPRPVVSDDPFYRRQLAKIAEKDPAYEKYVR